MTPAIAAVLSIAVNAQTASSVSLNAFPNPSNYGQLVTLSSAVTAGATGKVTFYSGTTILGVGAISGGTASISTVLLPPGANSLHAHYSGDGAYLPSDSTAMAQTVTEAASLGLNPAVNYGAGYAPATLVVGDFNGDGHADLAAASSYTTTVSILLGNADGTFQSFVSYTSGSGTPSALAVGDWNGDGKQDLAVSSSSGAITLLLGNGNGTFQDPANVCSNCGVTWIAAADFNADGKADLVASTNSGGSGAIVLLGNGDGTFQTPVKYLTGMNGSFVAVGDLNGDTKADFVIVSGSNYWALLGAGNGTFGAGIPSAVATGPSVLALADMNGDGKLDAVGLDSAGGVLYTSIGNGDGSFQTGVATPVSLGLPGLAVADVSGDGHADVVLRPNTDAVEVLIGNGDGTFKSPVTYPANATSSGVAIGDFNADGKADVAAPGGASNGQISVLLGGAIPDLSVSLTHGNGFTQGQAGATYKSVVQNSGAVATSGAVNLTFSLPMGFSATAISGSGWTCTLGTVSCTRSESLAAHASYPAVTVTVTVSNTPGSVMATATVSGGNDQNGSNNTASDTTNVRTATTVTLTSAPNPSTLGQAVTLTAAVGTGTGQVTFYDGTTLLGTATLSAGQANFTTSLLPSGSRSLTARYDGDTNYGPVVSAVRTQIVSVNSANGASPGASYRVGSSPYSAIVADVNKDGKPDILTANASDISLLLGNGDGTFQAATSVLAASGNQGFAAKDVNGDGNLDLLFSSDGGSVSVALGNGNGTFQTPTTIGAPSLGLLPGGLLAGDFNRDGFADILLLSNSGVTFYAGNGNGTFQPEAPSLLNTGLATSALTAMVDMNGDGILDIATSSNVLASSIYVYLGVGDGTFQSTPIQRDNGATYPNAIAAADFNANGTADVAQLYWVAINTYLGNGDGNLQSGVTSNLSLVPGYAMIVGDLNGDGKLDIAYGGYNASGVGVAFGNGNGTFGNPTSLPTDGYGGGFAAGDLNADGRPDFVFVNTTTGTINVFLGGQVSGLGVSSTHAGRFTAGSTGSYQITVSNPSYTPTSQTVSVTDVLPAGLTATAISGSGWNCTFATLTCTRSDALNTDYSYPPITVSVNVSSGLSPSTISNQASVTYKGITNYGFDSTAIVLASTTSLMVSSNQAALGASLTFTATVTGGTSGPVLFTEGGNVVGSALVSGGTAVLTTRLLGAGIHSVKATYAGDATHAASNSSAVIVTVASAVTSEISSATPYTTGTDPIFVISGDFDQNGSADLVTTNATANTVSVMLGNGNGTFQTKADYNAGTQPVAAATGDFNGDGKPDIAVANGGSKNLRVLIGKGDGTFNPATSIGTGADTPTSIAAVDWNQDGKADLLVLGSGNVFVFYGNGDGTFTRSAANLFSNNALTAVVADFTGDGKPDLLISQHSAMYLYPGNGDGTLNASPIYSPGPVDPTQTLAADLNGDGTQDVVSIEFGVAVDVAIGNGDGSFTSPVAYPMASFPVQIAIGDINGDGKLDIVSVNSPMDNVSARFGNGDGTFQAERNYANGPFPSALVLGDWNGDSRTDLAVANGSSDSISVYLGTFTPTLSATSTHIGNFNFGATGTYTLTVTNLGPAVTSGTLTLTDTLPAGLAAASINGSGWNCNLGTVSCSRSDVLAVNASYPVVTLVVNVANNAHSPAVNMVSISGGGGIPQNGTDSTIINAGPPVPLLTSPPDKATNISTHPMLTWYAAAGATSYDIYLGTSNPPAFVQNLTTTSYSATGLAEDQKYYWQVVAKNAGGSNPSIVQSFTTTSSSAQSISVSPSTGSSGRQVFTFTARDAGGYAGIQYMQFLFSKNGVNALNACYISFDPTNNVFYLLSDDATQWYGLIGGSAKTTGNGQCTIYGATSGSAKSGTDVGATVDISFRAGFSGSKNIYQFVGDTSNGTSGWNLLGTHNDTGDPNAIEVVSYSPSTGSGSSQIFTAVVREGAGATQIAFAQFVMNSTLNGYNGCFIHYDRASNVFFLLNDAGTDWYGLYAGSATQVSNSQCTLHGVGSGGTIAGSDLTISYKLDFAPGFTGAKNTYMQAADNSGVIEVWHQVGTWTP